MDEKIDTLYKYLPARRAATFFEKPTLRFTPPSELNDIFEVNPVITVLLSEEDASTLFHPTVIQNIAQKEIAIQRQTLLNSLKAQGVPDEFQKSLGLEFDKKIEAFLPHFSLHCSQTLIPYINDNLDAGVMQPYLEKRRIENKEGWGILSLSAIDNSLLMWAHYCEDHKGFVVELDASNQFFASHSNAIPFGGCAKVEYSHERVDVSPPILLQIAAEHGDDEAKRYLIKSLLLLKSKDWEYEHEWRVVLHNVESLAKYKNSQGGVIYGIDELPITAIKSVILGARAESELISLARHFTSTHNIPLLQAKPDHKKFALNISQFNAENLQTMYLTGPRKWCQRQ